MNQDEIRYRVKKYVIEKGVKWKHISNVIEVPNYILAAYHHGKKDLWPEPLARLDTFLKAEGF